MPVCKHCSLEGEGKYCFNCGEVYKTERITIHSLLHEVVHTLTHADKGFFYTLKNLAIHPGTMQKNYLQGERKTNQKPFPLFFICASVAAVVLHFVNAVPHGHQDHFEIVRESFYKNYYVIFQSSLLPFYAFLTWILFNNKEFNYAEALVLFMYALGFSLLIIIPINFWLYFFRSVNEQIIEVIVLGIYMVWTNLNFFRNRKRWLTILKSITLLAACYATSHYLTNAAIKMML